MLRGRPGVKPRLTEADRAISPDEVRSIVRHLEARARSAGKTRRGPRWRGAARDYLVARTLAETGLRASELARLDVGDLHLERGSPFLVVRGGKWRRSLEADSVPIPLDLAAELERWTRGRTDGPVFLRSGKDWSRAISRHEVYDAVKRAVRALGLNPRYSAHTLRHAYISALCRAPGSTPQAVAAMARLRTMDLVLRYYHLQPTEISRLAEAARVR